MKRESLEELAEGTIRYKFSAAVALDFERWAKEQRNATGRAAIPFSEYYNQLTDKEKLAISLTIATSF